jgi:hypothetical protein
LAQVDTDRNLPVTPCYRLWYARGWRLEGRPGQERRRSSSDDREMAVTLQASTAYPTTETWVSVAVAERWIYWPTLYAN